MNVFEELIQELGRLFNTPLHAERSRLCRLRINDLLQIQIEFDESKNRILLASFVCDLPPGKFRENVLREALKSNNLFPSVGTLAYSERNNKLVLFTYFSIASINANKLSEALLTFIDKADQWRVAVETGRLASISSSPPSKEGTPFGLK